MMIPLATFTWRAAMTGRWIARILGTLMVLFVLAFVFGEGAPSLIGMTAREQFYALGMACLFGGLILAWFREGWGGLVTLLGWGVLTVLAKKPVWDLPFSIPAATGLLHVLCWWRLRGPALAIAPLSAAQRVRILLIAGAPLAVFLVLCANEIFGNPPLMAWMGQPPSRVLGTWRGDLRTVTRHPLAAGIAVVFTIAPDGSVAGTIGGASLIEGRLERNRSWFGKLMHWRTDYLIYGRLSRAVESYGGIVGDDFIAPLGATGDQLSGSLFLSHPGRPMPLGLDLKKR
jgi:hypothetical protein